MTVVGILSFCPLTLRGSFTSCCRATGYAQGGGKCHEDADGNLKDGSPGFFLHGVRFLRLMERFFGGGVKEVRRFGELEKLRGVREVKGQQPFRPGEVTVGGTAPSLYLLQTTETTLTTQTTKMLQRQHKKSCISCICCISCRFGHHIGCCLNSLTP